MCDIDSEMQPGLNGADWWCSRDVSLLTECRSIFNNGDIKVPYYFPRSNEAGTTVPMVIN